MSSEMKQPIQATLGIGPMSSETIEAVFRYSHYHRKELMLIASKNQIDWAGGYVNKWTTAEYMEYVREMKERYPFAKVFICRDHCGPGFNGNHDLADVYKTIEEDIKQGFDLIHIDYCHFKGTKEEQFEESRKAIEYCLSLNPNIHLEVGTDENAGVNYNVANIEELEREIDYFTSVCTPDFYVVQTSSLTKEINQVGSFNAPFSKKMSEILASKGVKLKEHNADYLPFEEIQERKGIVGAINIAPQLGVIQTQFIFTKCLVYGIKFDAFVDEIYAGGKWKKWLHTNTADNKMLCAIIAGHYHFASDAYKQIISQLEEREDIHESIINELSNVIQHYQQ